MKSNPYSGVSYHKVKGGPVKRGEKSGPAIDPGFSPLSGIGHASKSGKTPKEGTVAYSRAT